MIDNINFTNVQRLDMWAPYPRDHNKSNVRRMTITFGDGEVVIINFTSDGDDVPIFMTDKDGVRYYMTDDSDDDDIPTVNHLTGKPMIKGIG